MNRKIAVAVMAVALFGFGPALAQTSRSPTVTAAQQASLDQGVAAYNRGDYATVLRFVRPLAEQGLAQAQGGLGFMYSNGHGVPQDYVQAVSWYRKAADQGSAPAQGGLGFMYSNGLGVPQDYAQAVSWYRKAAEQGDAQAQYNLGLMYHEGQGVTQDFVQAHKWFNLAAATGHATAAKNRATVAAKMTPAQIAEAQRLASEWKPTK